MRPARPLIPGWANRLAARRPADRAARPRPPRGRSAAGIAPSPAHGARSVRTFATSSCLIRTVWRAPTRRCRRCCLCPPHPGIGNERAAAAQDARHGAHGRPGNPDRRRGGVPRAPVDRRDLAPDRLAKPACGADPPRQRRELAGGEERPPGDRAGAAVVPRPGRGRRAGRRARKPTAPGTAGGRRRGGRAGYHALPAGRAAASGGLRAGRNCAARPGDACRGRGSDGPGQDGGRLGRRCCATAPSAGPGPDGRPQAAEAAPGAGRGRATAPSRARPLAAAPAAAAAAEPAQPPKTAPAAPAKAAEDDRVRILGVPLPSGRDIKETFESIGDAMLGRSSRL